MMLHTLLPLLLAMTLLQSNAATCEKASPSHTVALVELYTSEGCSSCPPADRWLSELGKRYTLDQVVPLALHVDYWDYIGWKDPFAQSQFTARQQWLTRLSASFSSYTPEVFTGLREVRKWYSPGEFEQRLQTIARHPARATIRLRATSNEKQVALDAEVKGPHKAQLVVVLYENKLSTQVRAGENSGATLAHSHVVRFASMPIDIPPNGAVAWKQTVDLPVHWTRKNLGVAGYVQDSAAGEVLQATAMPLCG